MKSVVSLGFCVVTFFGGCGSSDASHPLTPVQITPNAASPTEPPPSAPAVATRMDLDTMHQIVSALGTDVRRDGNVWEFRYESVPLVIVTDVRADRMRIISPVARVADLTPDQHSAVLHANFHSALDARYAASQGTLFSAFIHPLSTLHPSDLESGIRQTATLVRTFGTSYSSGDLLFGAP